MKIAPVFAAVVACAANPALAEPVKIYPAEVEPRTLEIAADTQVVSGGDTVTRFEAEFGASKTVMATGFAESRDGPGFGPRVEAYGVEGLLVLPRLAFLPFNWGVYGEYRAGARAGVADALEFKALASGAVGPIETRVNLSAEREIGSDAGDEGTEFTYGVQSRYAFGEDIAVGVQVSGDLGTSRDFGAFGRRTQLAGAVAAAALPLPGADTELALEAGYFFGLTDESPDGVARIKIAYERKF